MAFDQAIRPPTLSSVVIERIREAILSGELAPGTHLNEIELSKRLNVSRGTVREALRALQDESLVDIIPHRGCYVTKLTKKKAEEIYTLRSLIEPYAVKTAIEKNLFREKDLAEIEKLVDKLSSFEKADDWYEIINTDMKIHLLLSSRSGHELLLGVLRALQVQIKLFIINTKMYRSDSIGDEVAHREILEVVRRGDPEEAEEIIRNHIIDAGKSLVGKMKE